MPLLAITRQLDRQSVLDRLQKEQREFNAGSLAFFEIEFDEVMALAVIDFLQSSSQKGRRFGELTFYHCPGNRHVDKVLEVAVALDLFSNFYIQGRRAPNFRPLSLDLFGLQNMKQARHLNKIRLSVLSLSREDAAALKSGLENVGCRERGTPPLEHISLSNIRFQKDALAEICQGFRKNQSLLVVALICCGLADEEVAEVADSLASHPSLTMLRMSWNRCRNLGLQAFVRLLAGKGSKLQSLDIQHQHILRRGVRTEGGDRMRIEELLNGWERIRNKTLKRLVLAGNKLVDDDMDHLAMLLRRLSCLEELDLDSNRVTSNGLQIFAKHNISSRLRVLRLSMNPLSTDTSSALVKILQVYPELHVVISNDFWRWTKQETNIRHLMDINRAGRVLLNDNKAIPLSVWPLVLARLNACWGRPGGKNGMYYLLRRGPVLLERSITDSTQRSEPPRKRKRHSL
jgi:Ran GTPase-activating protein (RanGAP) involved in mRNA processing and transport